MRSEIFTLIERKRAEYYDKIFSGINPNPPMSDKKEEGTKDILEGKLLVFESEAQASLEEEKAKERKSALKRFHKKFDVEKIAKRVERSDRWKRFIDFILGIFDISDMSEA